MTTPDDATGEDAGAGWPPSPLWDYALGLYAAPGVEAAVLALQDRRGADVNLLLFACWLGATGRRLDPGRLAAVRAEAEAWQSELVRPLRAARRALKRRLAGLDPGLRPPLAAARGGLARVELALERGELLMLEALAGPAGAAGADDGPGLAASALAVLAGLGPGDADDELGVLLAAAFSGRNTADVRGLPTTEIREDRARGRLRGIK